MNIGIRNTSLALLLLFMVACKNEPDQAVPITPPTPPTPPLADAPEARTELTTLPPASTSDRSEDVGRAPTADRAKEIKEPEKPPATPTLGKLAPEIIGEDIDGQPMKLSDYRGKVVMLDFWGHW